MPSLEGFESESLPALETEFNERVRNMIELIKKEKGGAGQPVRVLTDKYPRLRQLMAELLSEDCRNVKREFTYMQFVTHIHKLVLAKS